MVVKDDLQRLGINYLTVELGEVEIPDGLTDVQRELFRAELLKSGLELMDDKKSVLIERIKAVIIEMVHYAEEEPKVNFSVYLTEKLNYDYTYLANLFSEGVGTTIEHFLIIHKIERVKELLVYNELSLTEIAYKMHYSSVSHLSNQFKKVTGLTTSHFKHLRNQRLTTLEKV